MINHRLINNNCDKVDVNYYRNSYGTEKKHVAKIQNNTYIHPVVYSIDKHNKLSLRYSNTTEHGHFNLTKFIFSNGCGYYKDYNGSYGLTEWAYCIYDHMNNLDNIEACFNNQHFKDVIESIQLDSKKYNIKVMKLFKQDFWSDFI